MSSGAAALLAGFSTAIVGVIAQAPKEIRYPGWSLFLLAFAAMAFVACVQCGFNARALMYSHAEIAEWRPLPWTREEVDFLHHDQQEEAKRGRRWEYAAEWAYHLGIVLLATGMGLVLVPRGDSADNLPRWIAAYAVAAAGVMQVAYYLGAWLKDMKRE
ncbi:hypothetical protein [Streptomyces sp. NPDC000410]|uniref:hypothetical protein n=1 Tax=Streptomyces sp. NPDC000410 TaxID=3154254 RepID=UPI00332D8FA4